MIESSQATIYWLVCDNCGTSSQMSDAWLEPEWAEENAVDHDWLRLDTDVHYCPSCAPTVEVCS